jgi:recombination protein RecA
MKIGVMFGNPETTTGGNALKFYASQRLDIRRIGAIKNGDQVVGSRTRVKVVKNKVAPPFKEVEFDIMYGTGISREGDLIDLAAQENIIEKSGAWYSFNGDRIGQGRENAKEYLREHPEVTRVIEQRVLEKFGIGKPALAVAEAPAEEAPEEKRARVKAVK